MQKDMIYDAAIIGAGPAGASLAYFLSDSGRKVVLIDRKKVADVPVRCAELMPKAITQLYDGKIAGINNEINHMETYINGKLANIIKSPGFMMDRNIFVDSLVREFVKRGGTYLNSANFLNAKYLDRQKRSRENGIDRNPEDRNYGTGFKEDDILNLSVYCRSKEKLVSLKTKILVGADGPGSRVRKIMSSFFDTGGAAYNALCNREQSAGNAATARREIRPTGYYVAAFQENLVKQKHYEDTTKIFFYPHLTCGYGWLFPKRSSVNVGVAISMEAAKSGSLKDIYLWFKNELIKNNFISGYEDQNNVIAGLAPVSGMEYQLVRGNIMLAGDAAGLCNPITGAGNFNAASSAKIVSEYIKKALDLGDFGILKEAGTEIKNFFNCSLSHARSKRNVLEENWEEDDFEGLIKKSWISFKDYWQRIRAENC